MFLTFLIEMLTEATKSYVTFYAGTAAEHVAKRHWGEAPKRRRAPKAPKRRGAR